MNTLLAQLLKQFKIAELGHLWQTQLQTLEQVSICVRIVNLNGHVSEHCLACQRAPGSSAEDLYRDIMSVLQFRDVSFDRLIAQAYDGASNMSGCYNGLQSLFQTRITVFSPERGTSIAPGL